MDEKAIRKEQEQLAEDPEFLDWLAERLAHRPAEIEDYFRSLATAITDSSALYQKTLMALEQAASAQTPLGNEQLAAIRSLGAQIGVDLTLRLRSIHLAQENPDSKDYMTEITPAEQLLGRLAQSFTLLIGLGYRPEVEGLLMPNHEVINRLQQVEVAEWLVQHTAAPPEPHQAAAPEQDADSSE